MKEMEEGKKMFVFLSCLPYIYWIGFVSHFGLYRRQTSEQGTYGSKQDNTPLSDDVEDVSVLLESEPIGPV